MHTFENNVEFENSETNLNQSFKNIEYPKWSLSLSTESGPPTNETMDLDWNLWACLNHSSNDSRRVSITRQIAQIKISNWK